MKYDEQISSCMYYLRAHCPLRYRNSFRDRWQLILFENYNFVRRGRRRNYRRIFWNTFFRTI